jgi:hypothetical protein
VSDGDATFARFRFETRVIYWRGPSPFFYAPIPPQLAQDIRQVAKIVTYGWGMVPVGARIGDVAFQTSLFPKDESYLLPLKTCVRQKANITASDWIAVDMTIRPPASEGHGRGRWSLA